MRCSGQLKKTIPMTQIIMPSVIWIVITCAILWLVDKWSLDYLEAFGGAMFLSFLGTLFQARNTWRDLEKDFNSTWGEFIK
jgi:hypothetical protein